MGHTEDTYEKYYTPTHVARDFQAIDFGTPPEEELIRSVASMGLSRDRGAPVELNDAQKEEVRNDPLLVSLRRQREAYKMELQEQGIYPVSRANGTPLHDKYKETVLKVASTYQQESRIRLKKAIRDFHDSIDTIEIAKQLSGNIARVLVNSVHTILCHMVQSSYVNLALSLLQMNVGKIERSWRCLSPSSL
jgi:hypothetical protein